MRLGILETGAPPPGPRELFGDYPSMFRRLFGQEVFDYRTYRVDQGELPRRADEVAGYVVTGSSAGVYDPLPWIDPLKDFLRAACGQVPLVGVCFGHQIMAEAFGGKVEKSSKGWGVGLHRYEVKRPMREMGDIGVFAAPASHQDQVVAPPPNAKVIAGSDFCPFGLLDYGAAKAVSVQLHPEFEPAYAKALIEVRRGQRYSDEEADRAILTYEQPDDRAALGAALAAVLRHRA